MNKEELKFILQSGEGYFVEFKENIDKTLAKEIVAFSNSQGGKIFIGITDKEQIKGIKITNKIKSQIQDIARNCDPPINIKLFTYKNKILIIEVHEGDKKPYSCSQGFFVRNGPNSQKLSRDEILSYNVYSESLCHSPNSTPLHFQPNSRRVSTILTQKQLYTDFYMNPYPHPVFRSIHRADGVQFY